MNDDASDPHTSPMTDELDSQLRVEHAYDDETPPSIALLQAIAIIENVDPVDLPDEFGLTLYDYVDPEALDRLVTSNTGSAAITIDLGLQSDHEYAVQIYETGQLVVQKAV